MSDSTNVSREELRLELKSLRSDLRLLIIASVALNQFLANVSLPKEITTSALALAIFAPAVKATAGVFLR